jgi:hypothetical protein
LGQQQEGGVLYVYVRIYLRVNVIYVHGRGAVATYANSVARSLQLSYVGLGQYLDG